MLVMEKNDARRMIQYCYDKPRLRRRPFALLLDGLDHLASDLCCFLEPRCKETCNTIQYIRQVSHRIRNR
jgi:hypothetical protein